jgi:small subunit ribosomal protein S21
MIINTQVTVGKGEGALDRALRVLKAKLDNEGIMDTVRAKRGYETPKQRQERKLRQRIKKAKLAKLRSRY